MSADVLFCAVDVVHSKTMILANSVLSLYLIYNNVLLLLAAKLADVLVGFVCFLPYFFILSLFNAFWYFFALALCSLSVFAKLCVPEKSSFAHMYR